MVEGDDPLGWSGGTIDGRISVDAVVGEGGFGIVYRGTHLGFDEPVAIKCLKVPRVLSEADRASFLEDFRAEARLLHRLSRKTRGIVQAFDVGAATSPRGIWTPYIAMEWLEGRSLAEEMMERVSHGSARRTLEEAVALLTPVAESLAVTHAEGIAHLDIKPANVFLTADGIKLLDFGVAKVLSTNASMTLAFTRTGERPPFTPAYSAPEQFDRRHGATGPWSDVYALALVLIETCSGEQALVGDTPVELYVASANEQYRPSLASHSVRASPEVDAVVKRALEVEPRLRFPDAASMWRELRQAMGGPSLAATVRSPKAPSRRSDTIGLNRVCTVLFAELQSAVEARELEPERLRELVSGCMSSLEKCVTKLGGTVEPLVDQRLMGVFGLYGDSASAAERAVQAALGMSAALAGITVPRRLAGVPLSLRIGVASGRAFANARQAAAGFQLSATGAPVTLGARLQQSAAPGTTLVDRDTYRQVAGLFDMDACTGDRGPAAIQKSYLLKGLAHDRHALHATAVRDFCGLTTTLVGREREMEALATFGGTVMKERSPRLVTLLGAPGAGKSRLLVELADRLEREGWLVLAGSSSALHMHTSYALAASLLRTRFHIHQDDSAAVAAEKLRRGVRRLRRDPGDELADFEETVGPLLLLLGVGAGEGALPLGAEEEGKAPKLRIAGAVTSLLGLAEGPVAILCDDLQWADESSLSLLEDLCTRMSDRPLLIVGAARSELVDRRPLRTEGFHVRLDVEPLDGGALEAMVRDRLRRVTELPEELVQRLASHADGSPLTLVETLHLLVDAEVIDARTWRAHMDRLGDLSLPTSVHGIVQARLDRLDDASCGLLARAAIVGRAFWDGVLLELEPKGRAQSALARSLAQLCDRGLVQARPSSTFPDEQEYVFCDAATQRVASEMLAHKERQQLHLVTARWLESRIASDAGAALVAGHYERGAALPEAFTAYRRAGAHAAALGQNAEALLCFERACGIEDWLCGDAEEPPRELGFSLWDEEMENLPPPAWHERAALRTEIGDVSRRMGNFDVAEDRYRQARQRTGSADDPREAERWQARLDYRLAVLDKLRGNVDAAIDLLEKALERAGERASPEEQAAMYALCASLMRRRGRLEACREACLRGLRVCRTSDSRGERWREAVSKLFNTLGSLFFMQDKTVQAERFYLQASRAVDERKGPGQASEALNNVAAVRYARGDLAGARDSFQRVIALTERSGDLWVRMTALANLGEVELADERAKVAKDCLVEAARLGEQIRAHLDLTEVYRNLARAELSAGDPDRALAAARRALELLRSSGGRLYLEGVSSTIAAVCGTIGASNEQARALGRELLELLDAIDGAAETAGRCRAQLEPLLAGA